MKKTNSVCISMIISIKTHTVFCFISEEEFSVQPLTSSGTYCSYWTAGGHWCPSVTYEGHSDRERLGDTTSLHGHT